MKTDAILDSRKDYHYGGAQLKVFEVWKVDAADVFANASGLITTVCSCANSEFERARPRRETS